MNVRLFERGTAKRTEGGATMNNPFSYSLSLLRAVIVVLCILFVSYFFCPGVMQHSLASESSIVIRTEACTS